MYWNVNNLSGRGISQKLPLDGLEWRKDRLRFDEQFIQNYDEDSDDRKVLLKSTLSIPKTYANYTVIYHFNQRE